MRVNAIRVPSGDHAGCRSSADKVDGAGTSVSVCPSATRTIRTVLMLPSPARVVWVTAIIVPSGDQAGSRSDSRVARVFSGTGLLPSAAAIITRLPDSPYSVYASRVPSTE